jgi:[protein-PII] uridylyltransferase
VNRVNSETALIKMHLTEIRASLFNAEDSLAAPLATLQTYSRSVDDALKEVFGRLLEKDGSERDYCLVALGGYGRRELWPFSDIDILILHRDRHDAEELSLMIKDFWSLGLSLGSVVRTVEECRSILGEDIATDTALLEARYLCGNRHLFERMQSSGIRPYFEKNKIKYIDEISATLREGLFSSENSLYRIEPDLKNGICTLRDCQRLLWAERVRHGAAGFARLHDKSGFSRIETKRFASDYAFLAGLRSALHVAAGQRLDVLETQYHQVIAARYPSGRQNAGDLLESFFKTVREIRLSLLSFLEKDLSGKSIWRNVRRRMSSVEIGPGIALLDGIIFPGSHKALRLDSPESVLNIFRQSLACQATLSVELRNKIRYGLDAIHSEDFKTRRAGQIFLEILSGPGAVGRTLLMMHETGLLSKLIPPFTSLTCKVEYDQYHEFTVDQHTLLALCACDDLAHDADEKIRALYSSLPDRFILRLAVLLHDIGKAKPGDHAKNGAVMAEAAGERLGLSDDQIAEIRFLVYHHLDMSNLSLLRDFDDHNLAQFAADVGCMEMLNLLYLLTIVDIRSVGHNTWTGWKAYQLEQLYDRVSRILRRLKMMIPERAPVKSAVAYPRTFDEMTSEEKSGYHQCLVSLTEDGIGFHSELFAGFERLMVCAVDRVGFLSDIIGCITSEGYNILSAKIHSDAPGRVLDIFHLEEPDKPRLTPKKRLDNIRCKWRLIAEGFSDADHLVKDRIRKYPPPLLRTIPGEASVNVRINNGDSASATIVEIDTADNFGLMHKIARCFYESRINIVAAKLSTRNDQACDVFYVTDDQNKKITDEADIKRLIARLKKRLSSEKNQWI